MTRLRKVALSLIVLAPGLAVAAEPARSTFSATSRAIVEGNVDALENVIFAFARCAPEKREGRLLLRLRIATKSNPDEVGTDGHVSLEALRPEAGPQAAPLYSVKVPGSDAQIRENCLFVVNRGLEDFDWYGVYSLRDGKLLFETMIEPLAIPLAVGDHLLESDLAGFYVPPDDEKNQRLARPEVVGLLTLAQEDKMQSRLLLTAADPALAKRLRSYWDERRYLSVVDAASGAALGKASAERPLAAHPLALELFFAAENLRLRVGLTRSGLDPKAATLPQGLRLERFDAAAE